MNYEGDYENALHFSSRFQQYAQQLAADLKTKYQLSQKNIVEIGCGSGHFLALLCNIGNNYGFGFDPSCTPKFDKEKNIRLIRADFNASNIDFPVDFVCCRHVLEHIPKPIDFLRNLRANLKKYGNATTLFFEVPNADYMLDQGSYFDIIYEHFTYFTATSIKYLFEQSGFVVEQIYDTYEGQFLCLEAKVNVSSKPNYNLHSEERSSRIKTADTFRNNYKRELANCKKYLSQFKKDRKKVVLWGAGSKGISLLNMLQEPHIEYVVDINPRKHYHYIPGTGQEIIPPTQLKSYSPDVIITMNPIYNNEIKALLYQQGINVQLINF